MNAPMIRRRGQGCGGDAVAADVADFEDLLAFAAAIEDEEELARFVDRLPTPVRRRMIETWAWQAHRGQLPPDRAGAGGEWRLWLLLAGRGFGKTRAGAEWVSEAARTNPRARIALVGATRDDVAKVMIEGRSGLLRVARTGEAPLWVPSRGVIRFASGAEGHVFSAEAGEGLRGPEHDFAWCDELAKWERAEACWDNLQMGLRAGERPRVLVTTTPRPLRLLRRIRDDKATAVTRGRTRDNLSLPQEGVDEVYRRYGGTRLGRQELDGVLFEELEGALWSRALIEESRNEGAPPDEFRRVVVGVDPPATAEGDKCGIVVCGLAADGIGYVLADLSVGGLSPEGWAQKVAAAAEAFGAHRVVAEGNIGGAMVEAVLRGANVSLPVRRVHARDGKSARAEPVAALFESKRARLAGTFPELEDELCGLVLGGGYEGPGRSPDRADAMVWALTELMLGKRRAPPRITVF